MKNAFLSTYKYEPYSFHNTHHLACQHYLYNLLTIIYDSYIFLLTMHTLSGLEIYSILIYYYYFFTTHLNCNYYL